ncbi:MAG: helix-turn-helix transcriptional regulator [Pelagimonas sp.]|jgi:excisionase family DNA binding protein|nr:helix-turn-helix transcriptional regulator [Pelagimonas sp.]
MTQAPSPEFLTVKELAELLRLKERKVYDLASSGAVPCSRATGKLLFPNKEIRDWIKRESIGLGEPDTPRPPILLGSHDPLLDWAVRQSRCGMASYFDGSLDGLARFHKGEGMLAGLHIHEPETAGWNVTRVSNECRGANVVLIGFALRQRGLVFRKDGPPLSGLQDLPGFRIAPRQPESGTDGVFRYLVGQAGIALAELTLTETLRTETEAVQAVARGVADVTFGLEPLAQDFQLGFLPLIEERFDLLIDRRSWFEPQMQRLMTFCRSEAFREKAEAMGGYDVSSIGQVRWNP